MFVLTVLLAIFVVVCTPLMWWYLSLQRYKTLSKIPGPRPLPLAGNAFEIGNTPQGLLKSFSRLSQQYGGFFKLCLGTEIRLVVARPDLMEYMMSSNIQISKSDSYNLLKPWLGDGLLVSTGDKWRSRRKMITPTFHFKILEQFLGVFNENSKVFVKKLSQVTNKTIDIYPLVNLLSLDVICETAMGVKINAQENEKQEYIVAVKGILTILSNRFFSFWEKIPIIFYMSSKYKPYKEYLKKLHDFTNDIITLRRRSFVDQRQKITPDDDGVKRKIALLDLLLESENCNKLTNEDLREEIDTFMFEGHDTTTSGICFTLLALAENPDVQEKLYEEISSAHHSRDFTLQELQEMKYLDMVIKEAQRLYPSVPVIERRIDEDCVISGHQVQKGTDITMLIYEMHWSEEFYPEPKKFDPYRFLPENQSQRHKFAYVPFSAGSRNCIGQKFALLDMKVVVAEVVKNFKLLPAPQYKPDLGLNGVLKSINGVCLQLQKR